MGGAQSNQEKAYDVVVIGGGASGMMAAGIASNRGLNVLLLEKNAKLGVKLSISGGGRCNIVNAEEDEKKLLSQYGKSEQFLYSSFSQFGMKETYEFFESHSLPLQIEARHRAFPKSERASDVVKTLEKYMKAGGVEIKLKSTVTHIHREGNHITSVEAGGRKYSARSYIFATGGVSRPETGSTGDGFRWLSVSAHTVAKPTPTIVPLLTKETWVKDIAGVSAQSVKITYKLEGKRAFSAEGAILFTHKGISGPAVLNSAGQVAELLEGGEVTAHIDFFRDTDAGSLDKKLSAFFDQNKNKSVLNAIREFSPPGIAFALLALTSIEKETKVHSVTREQRKKLSAQLKNTTLTISGLMGFEKAVVADGGVHLREIDTKTMRSKLVDNLFVIGDLLHITRPSGGYSLQLCWTSGFVAGSNA